MKAKPFLSSFLFLLALSACNINSKQLAPKSIEGLKIDFFLEKGLHVDENKNRIFYQYSFKADNIYTMKSNSPFKKHMEEEKTGGYDYFVKGKDRAILLVNYINSRGEKVTYEAHLNFEDLKSGTWNTSGSEVFHEANSGTFILEK